MLRICEPTKLSDMSMIDWQIKPPIEIGSMKINIRSVNIIYTHQNMHVYEWNGDAELMLMVEIGLCVMPYRLSDGRAKKDSASSISE